MTNNKLKEKPIENKELEIELGNLQQKPNSIATLEKIAKIYEQQQQLATAISYYQKIVELNSDRVNIYLKIASLQVRQKQFSASLKNYQTALKIQPQQPAWVFIGLGDALTQTNKIDEAILAFTKATELRSDYGLVYAKLASAMAYQNNDRATIETYQKAVDLQAELPFWVYINFAKILNRNNLYGRATKVCQHGAKQYPNRIGIKILLAEALQKQGKISQAIDTYQKIISLNPQQPAWLYQTLANLLVENQLEQLALEYYFQSIKVNHNGFYSYPYLDLALSKVLGDNYNQQQIEKLLEREFDPGSPELNRLKQYMRLGFLGTQGETIDPLGYYFINHNLKLLYCSIPKNACTLFKNIIIENSKYKQEYERSSQNIHQFIISKRGTVDNLLASLSAADYFKLAVLRNPFARLASGYLDKIAKHLQPESFAIDVIKDVQQHLGLAIDLKKSITFEQFIQYLARKKDRELNDHWKPQNNFVAGVKFDFIGQFENLNRTIDILQNNYNIRIKKKGSEHATKYQQFAEDIPFHTLYPQELRNLEGMPTAKQIYSPELEAIVRQRYDRDIALYEQTFAVDLSNLAECLE